MRAAAAALHIHRNPPLCSPCLAAVGSDDRALCDFQLSHADEAGAAVPAEPGVLHNQQQLFPSADGTRINSGDCQHQGKKRKNTKPTQQTTKPNNQNPTKTAKRSQPHLEMRSCKLAARLGKQSLPREKREAFPTTHISKAVTSLSLQAPKPWSLSTPDSGRGWRGQLPHFWFSSPNPALKSGCVHFYILSLCARAGAAAGKKASAHLYGRYHNLTVISLIGKRKITQPCLAFLPSATRALPGTGRERHHLARQTIRLPPRTWLFPGRLLS